MTAEEKRERLLKRLLPALVITVIYFVFVSAFIADQKDKAEDKYIKLKRQGVAQENLSSTNRQIQLINSQITKLTEKQQAHQSELKKMAEFIASSEANTESTNKLAKILADNKLRVIFETSKTIESELLNPSLKEIKQWLQPNQEIQAQSLEIQGSYLDMLHALKQINQEKLQALPVNFSMKPAEKPAHPTDLDWTLVLWM